MASAASSSAAASAAQVVPIGFCIRMVFVNAPSPRTIEPCTVLEVARTDLPANAPKSEVYQWFIYKRFGQKLQPLSFVSREGETRTFKEARLFVANKITDKKEEEGEESKVSASTQRNATLFLVDQDGNYVDEDDCSILLMEDEVARHSSFSALQRELEMYYIKLAERTTPGCTSWTRIPSRMFQVKIPNSTAEPTFIVVFDRDELRNQQPECYYYGSTLDELTFGSEFSHGACSGSGYYVYQNGVEFHHNHEMGPINWVIWTDKKQYAVSKNLPRNKVTVPQVAHFPFHEKLLAEIAAEETPGAVMIGHLMKAGVLLG